MQNTSNIWTGSSFLCYRDLCAASGGDHGFCTTDDVNVLLVLLLEQALDKGYLDENAKVRTVCSYLMDSYWFGEAVEDGSPFSFADVCHFSPSNFASSISTSYFAAFFVCTFDAEFAVDS